MTEEVFELLTGPIWLENPPLKWSDEYYTNIQHQFDFFDEYGTYEEMRDRLLIIPEWEVKLQENGYRNELKRKILLLSDDFVFSSKIATMSKNYDRYYQTKKTFNHPH